MSNSKPVGMATVLSVKTTVVHKQKLLSRVGRKVNSARERMYGRSNKVLDQFRDKTHEIDCGEKSRVSNQ